MPRLADTPLTPARRHLVAWAAFLLVLSASAIRGAADQQGPWPVWPQELDRTFAQYQSGDHDAAVAYLRDRFAAERPIDWPGWSRRFTERTLGHYRSGGDGNATVLLPDAVGALRQALGRWPAQTGAAFALEAAAAAYQFDRVSAREMLELGCDRVRRRDVPHDWALAWQLASVALLEDVATVGRYVGQALTLHLEQAAGQTRHEHIEHALRQFPNEPQLLFARGLVHQRTVHDFVSFRVPVLDHPQREPVGTDRRGRFGASDAIQDFTAVRQGPDESLHAAAALFIGLSRLLLEGRAAQAMEDWGRVIRDTRGVEDRRTEDVRYLALLFTGRALAEEGRGPEAIASLEAAIALRPRADSARVMLAALYFVNDRRAESIAVLPDPAGESAPGDDPWLTYLHGHRAEWPARLRAVREGLPR